MLVEAQVAVERVEEPAAVGCDDVGASECVRGVFPRATLGGASEAVTQFEDDGIEAPEHVRGGEAGDAAADDGDAGAIDRERSEFGERGRLIRMEGDVLIGEVIAGEPGGESESADGLGVHGQRRGRERAGPGERE